MDNLPKDPSSQNSNNNPVPQPFGSNFNPHTNPIDPNNPYQPQPNPVTPPPQTPPLNTPSIPENPDILKHEHYSEVAQNKPRDEHGHFKSVSSQAPLIHPQASQTPPITQTTPNTPNPSFLPPIIEINQNTKPTEKEDPPLFGFFILEPEYLAACCGDEWFTEELSRRDTPQFTAE